MNFWINFWMLFLFASLVIFAGLAVVITIGGFFNIRSLFKTLTKHNVRQDESSSKKDVNCG